MGNASVSGHTPARQGFVAHATHATLLAAFGGLLFFLARKVPEVEGTMGVIAGFGFLLVAGTLMSEMAAPLGLPHLTGYLMAGIASGPHVLGLVDEHTVKSLSPVNTLALCLIALAGGAELDLASVRRGARTLAWATLVQTAAVLLALGGVFMAARPLIPFARTLSFGALVGVALLWGSLAVSRSPSATLGILSQTRATGRLAMFTLAFVMASDVVVVVLLATVLGSVRSLIDPAATFSLGSFVTLGHELFGSVAIGTTLGLFIAAYLRLVNRQMLVVLLVLGFGASTVLEYLRFDSLLTFMVAGFIVRNMSKQGSKFVQYIEQTGTVVYVVFFAIAGADLDVPLLRTLWPAALILATTRALVTWGASRASARLAGDPVVLRHWGWSGLVSQAGLTLGLSLLVAREFPSLGTAFRALVVATVAINEVVGPVLFKLGLDRSGETSRLPAPSFPSMRPPPVRGAPDAMPEG
jgi:Kef-type K+ transport system membrane component KefB